MNEAMNVLLGRRSIRNYRPEPLKKEDLDAIVKAGLYAPSAKNLQSTMLVAVQDADTIGQAAVRASIQANADRLRLNARLIRYGASTLVAVLSDSTYPNWIQDGTLVMGNLMNAAAAMGIGSCWVNRAMESFDLPEGKALLAKWGLNENWKGIGYCFLGYTDAAVLGDKARKENRVLYV